MEELIAQAAQAAAAQAEEEVEEMPSPEEDPWFFLDLEHGEERLRRYLERDDPSKQWRR